MKRFISFLAATFILFCFLPSISVSALNYSSTFIFDGTERYYNQIQDWEVNKAKDKLISKHGSLDDLYYFASFDASNNMNIFYFRKSDNDIKFTYSDLMKSGIVSGSINVISYGAAYYQWYEYSVQDFSFSISGAGSVTHPSGEVVPLNQPKILCNFELDMSPKFLNFSVSPDLSLNLHLSDVSKFYVDVDNRTDNYYNYMLYVSETPSDLGIQNSVNNSCYYVSSKQWCLSYIDSKQASLDSLTSSVADWYIDGFGKNIFNSLGDAIDIATTFYDEYNNGVNFYQKSQMICPFYLIAPRDSRSHVIDVSSMNLSLDKSYYFNIIYYDVTPSHVYPSFGNYPNEVDETRYPIYRLDLISSYSSYSSSLFSFTDGNFSSVSDSLYNYSSLVTGKPSATISGSDNLVSIPSSSNTSYDSSVSTQYINNGTIYHNCNFSYGSSSGSSSGSFPDLPDADFKDLTDKTGKFFDFIKSIWIASGWLPAALFVTAVTVAIFCRVAGR